MLTAFNIINTSKSYGAAKHVKNLTFDSRTGELLEDLEDTLCFDEEKLHEEEKSDGYYSIVTNEYRERLQD
ncbi:MAG: hypothetical protein ACLKAK_02145 [Alkaliphilus sp.]